MIARIGDKLTFYCFYTGSKVGVEGLTVTAAGKDPAGTALTLGDVQDLGGGWYSAECDETQTVLPGQYRVTFATTSDTVDVRELPALWEVKDPAFFSGGGGGLGVATVQHARLTAYGDMHPGAYVVAPGGVTPSAAGRPNGLLLIDADGRMYFSLFGVWQAVVV